MFSAIHTIALAFPTFITICDFSTWSNAHIGPSIRLDKICNSLLLVEGSRMTSRHWVEASVSAHLTIIWVFASVTVVHAPRHLEITRAIRTCNSFLLVEGSRIRSRHWVEASVSASLTIVWIFSSVTVVHARFKITPAIRMCNSFLLVEGSRIRFCVTAFKSDDVFLPIFVLFRAVFIVSFGGTSNSPGGCIAVRGII